MANPPGLLQNPAPTRPPTGSSPSLRDVPIEDRASSQEDRHPTSSKKRYADKAQELGIIDRAGAPMGTRSNRKITLEKSDQATIKEFWKKPHRFSTERFDFQWTFDQMLALFVPCFLKTYRGTTIQMIQGVFPTVGKAFWQKQTDTAADSFITPEMWNFCTQTPHCYEFWVKLPLSDKDLCKEEILQKFQDLVLYFVAAQAGPTTSLSQVLHAFGNLKNEAISTDEDPSNNEIKEIFKTLQRTAKTNLFLQDPIFTATVEIPCGDGSFLKVTFTNCSPESARFRLDDFKLEIDAEDITLVCPFNPWEAFNDLLIHRMVLSQPQPDARALGLYWVHSVLEGEVFERDVLERTLVKEAKTNLSKAWKEGKKHLPPGDETLLAYYLVVADFLKRHQIPLKGFDFPDLNLLSVKTPFAKLILRSHPNISLYHLVLALMGILQANHVGPVTDAPRCRKTELCWRASVLLHIPFPGDYEQILQQKNEYSEEFLSCFSEVLDIFFPSLEDIPTQPISNPTIQEIYRALNGNPKFIHVAVRLFIIMNQPIVASNVLELPRWIESSGAKASSLLGNLEKLYERSRFSSLFSSVKARVLDSTSGPAVTEQFLTCGDPAILPAAWSRYKEVATLPFLLGTVFDSVTLPFALNRVCELCRAPDKPLTPEERTRLLSAYIDRSNQQGGALSAAYTPQLIEVIDPLITADPQLESHLSASARATLASSKSDQEKADLKSLKESSLLTSDPGAWWEKLLHFQQMTEERGTFGVHRGEFDALFIEGMKNSSARLHTRQGFKKTFDLVARRLFDLGEDVLLVSLLRQIPVTKADKIVHPWLCECITRAMGLDPSQGAHQWLPLVTALRETGAYQCVDRPFLVKLLSHMTMRFEEITEVPFLISQINPTRTEIPHLLDFLIEYYTHGYLTSYDSKGIDKVVLGHILDNMIKQLPLFISRKDDRIIVKISHIVSVLQKAPKDAELWSKFATLLDLLKQEDLFVEEAIAFLESLCTEEFLASSPITDPPFVCFGKPIPRMGKRLSAPQKARLARAYGAVVCHAVPHKKENEIIKVLPSLNWLTEQLRKDESWQNFARLFLSLHSRPSADLKNPTVAEDARWIASRVLTTPDEPLADELSSFLPSLPVENFQPPWKPLLAGLIACNPTASSTNKLYEILILLGDERERRFFQRCRDGQESTEALIEYQKTGVIPAEEPPIPLEETPPLDPHAQLRRQIEQAFSIHPMTAQLMMSIFTSLKTLPSVEHTLWERFFGYINATNNIPIGLVGAIWNIWSQKNRIENVRPEHGNYWYTAIQKCLGFSRDMGDYFSSFLIHRALPLLLQLEGEDCRRVATLCLKMGISHCWRKPIKSCHLELTALLIIVQSEPLKEKIGDPWTLLSIDSEFRFAMMLAQEASFAHHTAGHQRVILNTTIVEVEENFASEFNQELFSCFAERPYLPRDPESQKALQQWIEKSWPCLKANLEWNQACSLVRALCSFNLRTEGEIEPSDETESAFNKWEELANGSWADTSTFKEVMKNPRIGSLTFRPLIPPESAPPFFDATDALVEKVALTKGLSPERKVARLLSIYRCVTQNDFNDKTPLTKFKLRWGNQCFSLITPTTPHVETIVKIVLDDLFECMPNLKDDVDGEGKNAVESFIASLKNIINLGSEHATLIPLTKNIIILMTVIPWIMGAPHEAKHSWSYLLFCLCESLPAALPDRRKAVALAILDIFAGFTHLPTVEKRASALPLATLTGISLLQFTSHFITLTEAEDLSAGDWDRFFRGLSESQTNSMVSSLLEDLEAAAPEDKFKFSLALARTTLYTKTTDQRVFQLQTMAHCLPPFDQEENIFFQLLIRTKWILAIGAYMKKLEDSDTELLQAQKQIITLGLINGFITSIQTEDDFKKYSPFIFEVLKNSSDALFLSESFQFKESHPLAGRLKALKSLIDSRAKK